jgi:probable addiction module antidote protein
MPKRTRSYKAGQLERLKDPEYAAEYVNAAIEAGDSAAFLLALRNVAEAKTMSVVADHAGVSRESIYRMLSETGNPCYTNLLGIFSALGMKFNIQPAQPPQEESCEAKFVSTNYLSGTRAYSPLIWEVRDRPSQRFTKTLSKFAKGFYRHGERLIDYEASARATQSTPDEDLQMDLVA